MMTIRSKYFYGNEVSSYGQENGYVDYRTLAKAFDAVMSNDIISQTDGVIGYWEQESGYIDNSDQIEELEEEQDRQPDIFQWFIVSDNGAEILKEAGEIVYYNSELDMYLWGVTHWGTSWDYVLTNIKIEAEEE